MHNSIERAALVGIGLWAGIALSRTPLESAALPVYALSAVAIVLARVAVVKHRERRALK
jgi:hypothetical protein